MARLVALRYIGESASVPGCSCDGTGTLHRLSCDMTITPLQFACSGKYTVWRAFPLSMSIALGNISRQRFFMRRDFDGACTTTSLSIYFFFFISETLYYTVVAVL